MPRETWPGFTVILPDHALVAETRDVAVYRATHRMAMATRPTACVLIVDGAQVRYELQLRPPIWARRGETVGLEARWLKHLGMWDPEAIVSIFDADGRRVATIAAAAA